jgi:hypothetical protein
MVGKCIAVVFAGGFLSGCVTSGVEIVPIAMPRDQFDKLSMKIDQPSIFGKAWEKAKNNGVERERRLQPIFTESQARDAYKYLCKGGKPVRKINHQFQFVVPKVPVGITLTEAKKINASMLRLMHAQVASFYRLLAFGGADERVQGLRVHDSVIKNPRPFPYYMVKASGNAKETLNSLKSMTANLKDDPAAHPDGNDPVLEMMEANNSTFTPILVEIPGKKSERFASFVDVSLFGNPGRDKLDHLNFVTPPPGFTEVLPFELWAIREHFVLAVSGAELESWSRVASARFRGNVDQSLESTDPKQGSPLPTEDLLSDMTENRNNNVTQTIFARYLVSNTSIKEGTTDDGQIFTYDLALNTEPLCRLGRPAQDLLSK